MEQTGLDMLLWDREFSSKLETHFRQAVLVNTTEYIGALLPSFCAETPLYLIPSQVRRVCKYGSVPLPVFCVEITPKMGAILLVNLALSL